MGNEDVKRLNRLTSVLVQLQSKRVVKAQDIAERFNVSLRTVYRDIKTLEEAGIPLYGEAGKGYSIMEGYRLPPVMFTEEEALAMLTAEKMVAKFTDAATSKQYHSASLKIRSVLRYAEKDKLEELDDHIAVIENKYLPKTSNTELHLQRLLKAISDKQVLDMGYTKADDDSYSNRNVEPVGIYYHGSHWYLIAFCRLRQDYRNFRTDRISYLTPAGERFENTHPSLQSFIEKMRREKELHKVVIEVDKEAVKYFGNQKYYNGFVSQREINQAGKMEMTFLTGSLTGFAKFFLLFGEYADIVSPVSLKEKVSFLLQVVSERIKK